MKKKILAAILATSLLFADVLPALATEETEVPGTEYTENVSDTVSIEEGAAAEEEQETPDTTSDAAQNQGEETEAGEVSPDTGAAAPEDSDAGAVDGEIPEGEITGETAEEVLPDEAVTSEEEEEGQEELKENSFRYVDGEPITTRSRARSTQHPNAYKKINGVCYNSQGEPVQGATLKGIDVSEHQGKIDWTKVKNSDVDFAIIRVGYGDNVSNQDDKYWEYNVSECERLGIPYGVYIYSYAMSTEDAKSEAEHVLRLIKGHNLSFPIYYDLENEGGTKENPDKWNQTKLSAKTLGDIAETFCNAISNAGYSVGIYSNTNWFTNILTDSRFAKWDKWVAQYNTTCTYKGSYDMWQCTSAGQVDGIVGEDGEPGPVDINFWFGDTDSMLPGSVAVSDTTLLSYNAHIQNIGWTQTKHNGAAEGTIGESLRMEAIKMSVDSSYDGSIEYSTHVENIGWQSYKKDGAVSGTEGKNLRVEAIKIRLTGALAENYDVYYRVHVQNFGWMGWAKNDQVAGTVNYGYRMEAIQIAIVEKGSDAPGSTSNPSYTNQTKASYRTHIQNIGWQSAKTNGETSGTTNQSLRMEALQLSLDRPLYSGSIQYSVHVQNIGWQSARKDGQTAGTTGQSLRLEAVKISLTGDMAKNYDVYYRVHIQNEGWMDWAKNGDPAGSSGYSYRMEAIQIKILPKSDTSIQTGNHAYISK